MRNIVRFNWHFYAFAFTLAAILGLILVAGPVAVRSFAGVGLGLLLAPVFASLAVSTYVYDLSDLYRLTWLPPTSLASPALLTVNAGFDEISPSLQLKYAASSLLALDFYDPARHTEISIRRARRAYAPFPGTCQVDARATLPLADDSIDFAFAFMAAHEIRDASERADFFQELRRVTKSTGLIIVTEHLRDPANFLAYAIGFLHFYSRNAWLSTFRKAGLELRREIKITPFVTTFLLSKNEGTA
ncbi:class I SAM-dependent methyltransferase [Hymenobacter sp. B1770]|uniref:class I SAM-dependent methyltransferase n=1 Tax=Hymenobacter sp. B1770 TaxID=1718788 RepID=UPI003CEF6B8A